MFDRAIEKHAACAAAINCSGLEPGPSSKRDLKVYPPVIESPAVKVPLPVGTSPFHSAVPLAVMSPPAPRVQYLGRAYPACLARVDGRPAKETAPRSDDS